MNLSTVLIALGLGVVFAVGTIAGAETALRVLLAWLHILPPEQYAWVRALNYVLPPLILAWAAWLNWHRRKSGREFRW